MANTIVLKKSSMPEKKPNVADLEIGEIAVNLSDKKLYSKNSSNEVIQLSSANLIGLGDVSNIAPLDLQFIQFDSGLFRSKTISPNLTVNVSGFVTASANVTFNDLTSNTINLDTVAVLPYVANLIASTGVTITGLVGANSIATISIGQNVYPVSNVVWNNITSNNNVNAVSALFTNNVHASSGIFSANVNAVDVRVTNNVNTIGRVVAGSFSGIGQGFSNVTLLTAGTSWTIPDGVTRWKVTLVGAGGQGGGCPTTRQRIGNGGGSGGVAIKVFSKVDGQNSMSYSIGIGGSTAGTNATGQSGTSTTATYNSLTATANGGAGGLTSGTENGGGDGGSATNGDINLIGFKGSSGGASNSNNTALHGEGGSSPLGFGQGGTYNGIVSGGDGIAGEGYGSGGSGGKTGSSTTARAGGPGAQGCIFVEW